MARTALGKGLAPLMAGNKPPETASETSSAAQPGIGVVTLLHGKQTNTIAEPAALATPSQSAIPEVKPQPAPVTIVQPLPWWPFVLADVLLVGAAVLLMVFAARPLSRLAWVAAIVLVFTGGVMTLLPLWLNAHSGAQPKEPKPSPFKDRLPIEPA